MLPVIIISLATCVLLMLVAFFKPSINTKHGSISIYWIVPLVGAVIMIASNFVDIPTIVQEFTSDNAINPLKILILFLSMTLISIYLDNVGFFHYLASKVLLRAGKNQIKLFVYLYLTVSILTIFTSNDIIVLTFTPFICYFSKSAKIDPLPYLITEFIAANTWSMILIIGNPTNIYLATGAGATFSDYTMKMWLPTLAAGILSFAVLFLLFRKKLTSHIESKGEIHELKDKPAVAIGLVHLAGCIIMLVISSYTSLPMWIIALGFFISLFLIASVYMLASKKGLKVMRQTFKRAPWETVPFVLSMFVIVLALEKADITVKAAELLSHGNTVMNFGISSFLAANLINNIPMSVLFSSITGSLNTAAYTPALYASVIGSNLGAFLTPLGALAGIMWTNQLKSSEVKMTFAKFTKYGLITAIPAIAAALFALSILV